MTRLADVKTELALGRRQIVADVETTGFSPEEGDRMVELAAVEVVDLIPTGRKLHLYFNPRRDMPEEAFKIHGISSQFLSDKPDFEQCAEEIHEFLGDAQLVAHNGEFDLKFLNHELGLAGFAAIEPARLIDTLKIAKELFPGSPANLDALARRFRIQNRRVEIEGRHGALIDTMLLSDIYIELLGGRQRALDLVMSSDAADESVIDADDMPKATLKIAPSTEELARHQAFLAKAVQNPIWSRQ